MNWIKEHHQKVKDTVANCRNIYKSALKQQIFGLDIGSSAIKIVQLRKNENGYFVAGAAISFVENVNFSKAIRQCRQWSQVKNKLAVCGVSGQETAVRNFNFPPLNPEEIEGAVLLEAKQVCPFNTDDGVVDYQVISGTEKEITGFWVAASNKLLKEKRNFANESSLDPVLMDIDGLALMNCMRYCRGDERGTFAILNVGYEYTTLALIGDDDLPFVRDINFGGKAIVEQIALQGQFSAGEIEKVLRGDDSSSDIQMKINDHLESGCHKLISNITETLYYDAVHRKSEIVDKIYLCGGFSLVNGFASLLKNKLPSETILWNPFDTIQCDPTLGCFDLLRKNGPAFAVAAGLAMRQI